MDILPPSMRVASNATPTSSSSNNYNEKLVTGQKPVEDFWNMDLSDILGDDSSDAGAAKSLDLRRSRTCGDSASSDAVVRPLSDSRARTSDPTLRSSSRGRPSDPTLLRSSRSNDEADSVSRMRRSDTSPAPLNRSTDRPKAASLSPSRGRDVVPTSPRRGRANGRTNRATPTASSPKRGRSRSKSPLRHLPIPSFKKSTSGGSLNSRPKNSSDSDLLQRGVSFDKVQVREFQLILGDTPCKDNGPSLGLGWRYNQIKDADLEKYEKKRQGISTGMLGTLKSSLLIGSSSSSSSKSEGVAKGVHSLSAKEREIIAIELGYSWDEIQQNKKQNQRIQKQRKKTLDDMLQIQKAGCGGPSPSFDPKAFVQAARRAHGFTTASTNDTDC